MIPLVLALLAAGSDKFNLAGVKSAADWEPRRARILAAMQEVMGPLPSPTRAVPLDVTIDEEVDAGTHVRRKLTFAAEAGDRVPLRQARDTVRKLREQKGMVLDPDDRDTWSVIDSRRKYVSPSGSRTSAGRFGRTTHRVSYFRRTCPSAVVSVPLSVFTRHARSNAGPGSGE